MLVTLGPLIVGADSIEPEAVPDPINPLSELTDTETQSRSEHPYG